MEENNSHSSGGPNGQTQKKLLENPFVGSLVVPIAIVLVGALIIFGVTKMLNSERSYRDLVQELQSKTFGNKWIAAYELSKKIATSQIPAEDVPYVVKVLGETYQESAQDPRTRDFVIVALGVLKSEVGLPFIYSALSDADANVRYHAIVALANMPKEMAIDWAQVLPFLKNDDPGMKQVAILALSTHKVAQAAPEILGLLSDGNQLVKYTAATGLINYQSPEAVEILKEILTLREPEAANKTNSVGLDGQQVANLKIAVLGALQANNWKVLNDSLEKFSEAEQNQQIALRMKEALNKLKN